MQIRTAIGGAAKLKPVDHIGGYTRAGDDRRWLPSVTWFLARPRLAFRDLRQARRTAGRKALTAKLPGHR
jgi:hypothetical protein